jgi:hypothetical protein
MDDLGIPNADVGAARRRFNGPFDNSPPVHVVATAESWAPPGKRNSTIGSVLDEELT